MHLQRACACGNHSHGGGECAECKKKREGTLQRAAARQAQGSHIPPMVHDVLNSPGHPLDPETRTFMEPRFGQDFSRVRVHTDTKAQASASAVNALAYTVGRDVVFGAGQYRPTTEAGRKLMAHELTHVVQQEHGGMGLDAYGITPETHPSEREAENAANTIAAGGSPTVSLRASRPRLSRAKGDLVAYTGGQSGTLIVLQAGSLIYMAPAVSGHLGKGIWEPSEGPIPDGMYTIHPGITRSTVSKIEDGVCGALGLASGYQEITSTDPSPCEGAHYCNQPCPTPANPAQMCFTPVDCWGSKRIKIEGSKVVTAPDKSKVTRDGFYIHGGNPKDAVSSGCVKSLDNGVFEQIRKLTGVKGAVPFCVGSACPPDVSKAVTKTMTELGVGALKGAANMILSPLDFLWSGDDK